jgi:hypothetical protein
MFRLICRRIVALAVAYAVALNLIVPLLAALASAAQADPATLVELCAADQGGAGSSGDRPVRHGPLCPLGPTCLMQDCGPNGVLAHGSQTVTTFSPQSTAALLSIHPDDERLLLRAIGARSARAPPQA